MSEHAFPFTVTDRHGDETNYFGMTLRDYFAAKAMNAYINAIVNSFMDDKCEKIGCDAEVVANVAYQYADAMIKARES
jgi:hypothetical protein